MFSATVLGGLATTCHVDPPLSGPIRIHPKILCPRLREIDFIRWIGASVPAGVLWRAFKPTPETVKNSQERAGAPARSAPVTHRGFRGQPATGVTESETAVGAHQLSSLE